jgi:hypothetical protein
MIFATAIVFLMLAIPLVGEHSLSHIDGTIILGIATFTMALYMVILRCFLGYTIGEWACDLRLGRPHQFVQPTYPIRVLLRFLLNLATGMITLPLLSLIVGQDLAGRWTGVALFTRVSGP